MFADHLDKKICTPDVEMVPNRNGYGEGLKAAGEKHENVVALCCDLTESTRTHHFAEAFPERFVQMGIAEQSMVSVGAGMALMGKIPFCASYAMFSPGRSWEQMRTTVAYNDANVKLVGAHAGVSVGPDGATHQAIEDIAITRVVPNLVVLAPVDVHQAHQAVLAAAEHVGPVYLRVARGKTPVVTTPDSPFAIGKAYTYLYKESSHEKTVGIIVTGTLTHTALEAGKELNENGVGASVLAMPTIKPLDTAALDTFAAEHEYIVTLEEHQVAGGLGSAVAEYYSETNPKRVVRLGVHDQFGESGAPDELYEHFGMDKRTVVETVNGLFS